MNAFLTALQVEGLKARRSKVPLLTAIGFSLAPLVGGLFMIILKDPEAARQMGLVSAKAQLTVGVADWPAFFGLLAQAVAVGGALLFAIVTIWVFGREFSDRTVKELLALPTPREAIVGAKFVLVGLWGVGLTLLVFVLGLVVGMLVDIPGWSWALLQQALGDVIGAGLLTLALMPCKTFICPMRFSLSVFIFAISPLYCMRTMSSRLSALFARCSQCEALSWNSRTL